MKKRILVTMVALMTSIVAIGCSSNTQQQEPKETTSNEKQLEEVSVVLDWYPNAIHGFMYVADELGYYEEEGIKLKILFPANPNDGISMPAAGKADLGVYYLQDLITARANEGVPVKSIGAIVQEPLNIFLSLKDKNITKAEDLMGKTIGYAGTALSEAIVETTVKAVGGSIDDIKLIDVGFDLMSSMTTGNVDATIGCLVNHEVPAMEAEGFEVNYFFPNDYGMPSYYEAVFVAGDKTIDEQSDKLSRFLKASKKGFEYMKENPEKALDILMENQNKENFPLDREVEKQSFDYLIPIMEKADTPFLIQSKEVWQENADWLLENGLIKEKFDASEVIAELE